MRVVKSLIVLLLIAGSGPAISAPPAGLGPIHGRLVWVDFWASWCAPCRRSFPWLDEMYRKYRSRGLQIIAVNVDTDKAAADKFLEQTPVSFKIEFDPKGKLASEFNVQAMPSSYLLDPAGHILQRHLGFRLADTREYETQIRAALTAARSGSD